MTKRGGFVPTCTIVAGPNGSGKSTVLRELDPPGEVVNADDYARRLDPDRPESVSAIAGRHVLLRLSELIAQGQNFSYETTLSSHQAIKLMGEAKKAGFRIELAFLLLRSADLHIARVKTRVAQGGHDIPVSTILRRYDRTFEQLPAALAMADQAIIYDNTERELKTLVRLDQRQIVFSALQPASILHGRLAEALATALGVSNARVFRA